MLHFLFFVHFLYPYRVTGLLISMLSCWVRDSSPCLAHMASFWVRIKQTILKILCLLYSVLVEKLQRKWLTKWISQLHTDLWGTAEKFLATSQATLSQACMENCVCALGCYLTLLPFSLCSF